MADCITVFGEVQQKREGISGSREEEDGAGVVREVLGATDLNQKYSSWGRSPPYLPYIICRSGAKGMNKGWGCPDGETTMRGTVSQLATPVRCMGEASTQGG